MLKITTFLLFVCFITMDSLCAQKKYPIRKGDTTNTINNKKTIYRLSPIYDGKNALPPIVSTYTGSDINAILNSIKRESNGKPITLFDYMYTNVKGILVKNDTIP